MVALSLGLAALVPKCPMCLAAYASLLGIGAGLAVPAYPYLRPVLYTLAALALGAMCLGRLRLARQRARQAGQR